MRRLLVAALIVAAFLLVAVAAPARADRRLEARTPDGRVAIELVTADPAAGRAAIDAALAELGELATLLDPDAGGLGELNRSAGQGAVTVDPRLLTVLARAATVCAWSEGVHGPLGGWLNEAWGVRRGVAGLPPPPVIARAVELAACDGLGVDRAAGTVTVAAGRRVDLRGFADGALVDRGLEVLGEHGEANAWLRVGRVQRGRGDGSGGGGWPVRLAVDPQLAQHIDGMLLADASLAVADRPRLSIAGDAHAAYIDQRRGLPARGVLAVAVVTEAALDAEALSVALFSLGSRRGSHLAGGLRPAPSVLWLLGQGEGLPLVTDLRWSDVRRAGNAE